MEKLTSLPLLTREEVVRAAFAEKKGREVRGESPYTCYINVDSPRPNLAHLTASMLEELRNKPLEGFFWAKAWDKSVVSINPGERVGCHLLENLSVKGKLFVSVETTREVDTETLVAQLPEGSLARLGINSQPMTVEAFLICYFHMVNELVWDMALLEAAQERVSARSYKSALEKVMEQGFGVKLMSDTEMVNLKTECSETSMRIYGSKVNKKVPQIMGVIIR